MHKLLLKFSLLALGLALLQTQVDAAREILLALTLLWIIAFLWLFETLHITITALLVPVLAVAFGLLDMEAALVNFAHPVIFLFLGGFALAAALHVQGVDRWLAGAVLRLSGGRLGLGVTLLALMTALLSMWISNTAVTAVMLPLILGLLSRDEGLSLRTQTFCLLAIAYSANVGGIGTLVGSPPNAIVAAELGLSFVDWLRIGLPVALLLWPLVLAVLYLVLQPRFHGGLVDLDDEDFEWTRPRRVLVAIFALTVTGWLLGQPLAVLLGLTGDTDTWMALSAIALLGITGVARWHEIEKSADWGVLLLFGGGLTLSAILRASGASEFLGGGLAVLVSDWGAVWVILAIVAFVIFLTEITSNTATTALLVPVFVALPATLIDPTLAALAVGLSASCAFMLPVATPPNALVHGTGRVPQRTMLRAGLALNLLCMAALTLALSLLPLAR